MRMQFVQTGEGPRHELTPVFLSAYTRVPRVGDELLDRRPGTVKDTCVFVVMRVVWNFPESVVFVHYEWKIVV